MCDKRMFRPAEKKIITEEPVGTPKNKELEKEEKKNRR